jgi:dye decolorizing peroxidase
VQESAEDHPVEAGIGRRQLAGLFAAGAVGALVGGTVAASASADRAPAPNSASLGDVGARTIAFRGEHQAGIVSPYRPQAHGWVAAFDLEPGVTRDGLRDLLQRWTQAAESLTAGRSLGAPDDAVVAGLGPAALTVTVGFGPSIFGKAGLAVSARPEALASLPAFAGDALDPALCDGDLGVVVAADDPVVVAHAARVLGRLAAGAAHLRWQLSGFNAARGVGSEIATGRNLMGQVDGTNNPQPADVDFETKLFAGSSAPAFMRGGSYLVVRRIRMLLDNWDGLAQAQKERFVGRRLSDGSPLTGSGERTPVDLGARGADGSLVIDANAHIRLAAPSSNGGAAMLRRGFSYVDGPAQGLLFLAWQADPRHGFIPVQQRLAGNDLLHTVLRHESSAIFAMPGGTGAGGYLGQSLLESL